MSGKVYAKTDKGREEIATRKYRLPAKLRALLLMIDGQRTLAALAQQAGLSDLADAHAAALLQAGLIALVAAPEAAPATVRVPKAVAAPRAAPPDKANLHDIYSSRYRTSE